MRLKKFEIINGDKTTEYWKISWKSNFDSDNDLPLNKPLIFPTMKIVVRSAFEYEGKFF